MTSGIRNENSSKPLNSNEMRGAPEYYLALNYLLDSSAAVGAGWCFRRPLSSSYQTAHGVDSRGAMRRCCPDRTGDG